MKSKFCLTDALSTITSEDSFTTDVFSAYFDCVRGYVIRKSKLCSRCVIKLAVYVDLDVIKKNILRIKTDVGVKVMLMVKADAYGHGLCKVARAVEDTVDAFGVATLEEGIALRKSGIKKEILVLACAPYEIVDLVENGLSFGLANFVMLSDLESLISARRIDAKEVKIHIAVDSGMHRLGFSESEVDRLTERMKGIGLAPRGVYSHLRVRSYAQIRAFERVCDKIAEVYPSAVRHIASSHSCAVRRMRYDMVRLGIAAYKGAMTVESEVIAARQVQKGEFISYGNYKAKQALNTAVVFGGYADGANRERPSAVYIRGRECRVLGRVCMDMCIVDCGDFLPEIGEKAILTSPETFSDTASQRGSIEYTVMTCWRGRIERIYVNDKGGSEKNGKNCGSENERGRKRVGERRDMRRYERT